MRKILAKTEDGVRLSVIVKNPNANRDNANWTLEAIRDAKKQSESGAVLLTGMGCDKPYYTYWDRLLLNASQVTNPSIDRSH